MRYAFSLRWLKFAFIAIIGWLIVAVLITKGLDAIGRPEWRPMLFVALLPFAIWYWRRYARDRAEFDKHRG